MSLEITPDVEIYAADGWRDITEKVQNPDGTQTVDLEHANRGISGGIPEPSECAMVWDCTDGLLWPGNPMSDYYPSLDQNVPVRVALRLLDYDFAATVVDGIGPVTGTLGSYTVANTGAGGVVAASNFQQASGVATHSVPTTSSYRQTVLTTFLLRDVEQSLDFQLPTADVTGGAVEPANLIFRSTADEHLLLRVTAETDETFTLHYRRILAGGSEFVLTDSATATVTNTGQWLRVKGNVEADRVQAKIWAAADPEPIDWDLDTNLGGASSLIDVQYKGAIGWRTGVASGNTNAKPIVVSYDNYMVRSIRFVGEVADFDLDVVDETANVLLLPVVAAGSSRRMMQGETPVQSALRRAIPAATGVVWYCPMEDPAGSTVFASGLAGQPPMVPLSGTPGYADYDEIDGSAPLPSGNFSDWSGEVPAYTDTGVVQFRFVMRLVTAGIPDLSILARWYTEHASAKFWQLVYRTGGDLQLQWWNSESLLVNQSGVLNFNLDDDTPYRISIELSNDGADVDWKVSRVNINDFAGGTFISGTATSVQVSTVKRVWFNLQLRETPVFGHAYLQDQVTDIFELLDPLLAYDGDEVTERLERLLEENGFPFTAITGLSDNFTMGPQLGGNLLDLVKEPVEVDIAGAWYDARTHRGIVYRSRPAMYLPDAIVSLSYSGHQLTRPWKPIINDRDTRNRVTVRRDGGSEATYELTSGRKSTLLPGKGGVGLYPGGSVTVNAEDDSGLAQMAAFRVALGTVEEPRFPAAIVNLAAPPLLADPTIALALLDLRPGDVYEVTGASAIYQFDTVRQRIVGYRERINQFMHTFELIGEPASPFDAFVPAEDDLSGAERARADSDTASLEDEIDDTQTTFTVASSDKTLWVDTSTHAAHFPFDVRAGGEVMTCTAITTVTPTFVAAGAAVAADNASVVPGLPVGAAEDDLLIVLAAGRDFGNALSTASSGWEVMWSLGNITWFWKVHGAVEATGPTIAIGGTHAAGDTVQAQMIAIRDCPQVIRTSTQEFNGTSQNLFYPSLYGLISKGLLVTGAWKQDDWTSVGTLSGYTEIGEPASTLGNDQGLVWDYKAVTGEVANAFGSFVVTGGAAAFSRGMSVLLGNWQEFTVTRGVNGVVKSHAAGTPVRLDRPSRWPL
jgi:hypothetical protein